MPLTVRSATETDRSAILSLMRQGDFNRVNLKPVCFVVAEVDSQVIGVGQIIRHRDGTAELASLVVAADRRSQGVGSAIVRALLARHTGVLYLFCLAELEGYYARFGFSKIERSTLPRSLARIHRFGNWFGRLPPLFGRRPLRVIAMHIFITPRR
jgi:N-acetylglutamate synthase-like GNAT family acetyltransferase